MKKFIVETYYTCTFKTVHTLNDLNDKELSKIDSRTDGNVEVLDVKLNNRKTKKIGETKKSNKESVQVDSSISQALTSKVKNSNKIETNNQTNLKLKNKARFKMPDRRKRLHSKSSDW